MYAIYLYFIKTISQSNSFIKNSGKKIPQRFTVGVRHDLPWTFVGLILYRIMCDGWVWGRKSYKEVDLIQFNKHLVSMYEMQS